MSSISVAGRPLADDYQGFFAGHLYLIYTDNENNKFFLSGFDEGFLDLDNYAGSCWVPYGESSESYIDQSSTDIVHIGTLEGDVADSAKEAIDQLALAIDAKQFDYNLAWRNSNSLVGTLLNLVGLDIDDYEPDPDWALLGFVGMNNFLEFDYAIHGTGNADHLRGAGGKQSFYGFGGIDHLEGGAGNDTLYGGSGNDVLIGGTGSDTVDYGDNGFDPGAPGTQRVVVNLTLGTATDNWGNSDSLKTIENVNGSSLGDVITGDGNANTLFGFGGDDTLNGASGNDKLFGGDGNDFLIGGAGRDTLDGGSENFSPGTYSADRASYQFSTSGVTIDLAKGTGKRGDAEGDTLRDIENVFGSMFDDVLRGSDEENQLFGFSGIDKLYGGGGDDYLEGGLDPDVLDGGAGNDLLSYSNSSVGVTINLSTGLAKGGEAEGDTIRNFEHLNGSLGNDNLTGNAGRNQINGQAGNDVMTGNGGSDFFYFENGDGNDTITDFDAGIGNGDTLRAFGFSTFQQIIAASTDVGQDVRVQFDGNDSVTLRGLNIADLYQNDFLLF